MNVALFTDSLMHRTPDGIPYPVRDQFIHFISPLGKLIGHLEIVSKCKIADIHPEDFNPLVTDDHLSFSDLPFSSCTEDFFKKMPLIIRKALPVIRNSIERSDLVILRIHNSLSWFIARCALKKRRPLVLYWAGGPILDSVKENYPRYTPKHLLARLAARFEDMLSVRILSKATYNFFIDIRSYRKLGSPRNTSWVVPNLISHADIESSPRKRTGKKLNIVFAGRLFRLKGIYDLIEAVQILERDGIPISLSIAGDGPEQNNLEKEIISRKLVGVVKMEGNLSRQRLNELLLSSDVHVLPSYAEGLPKVLWEGWAAGLATIITDVGSVSLYLEDGKNGILIRPGNIPELVSALAKTARNEDFRFRLAEQGIMTVQKYTWDQELVKIQSILNKIVMANRSGE